jgi:3',5'-cyclic AMP phosphodiesterase CpdA
MKGRLHSECGVIVRLMLEDMTARGCELLVSPGDIVNAGLPEEYALAADLLRSCPLPFHVTPGNHDIPNDGWQHFRRQFGSGTWLRQLHGFQFAALETGDGLLDKPENMELLSAMDETRPLLLFTHYQLFPDQWIPDANRAISDAAAPNCVKMLEKLARCSGIVYVGHKNVAAQVKINRLVQLNTPQPTHFPAGYLLADFYEDGVWHQFVPLASEVLNEYSRLGTEHSKPHFKEGCCCRSEYRDRFTKDVWNQVITIA